MTIFNISNQLNQDYKNNLPKKGKLLSIDVGTQKIGLASCDETRLICTPKSIIKRQSNIKDFAVISEIINNDRIVALVIGRPITMDGSIHQMTLYSEKFAKELDDFLDNKVPIFLFEERLTSFEARSLSKSFGIRKNTKQIDDIASALILEHFIEFIKQ